MRTHDRYHAGRANSDAFFRSRSSLRMRRLRLALQLPIGKVIVTINENCTIVGEINRSPLPCLIMTATASTVTAIIIHEKDLLNTR
jgi:hypothetical protein